MPLPVTARITDPDLALLEVLTDPWFPEAWQRFDGRTESLAAWVEEAGRDDQAPDALRLMLANGLSPTVPVRAGTPLLHFLAAEGITALVRTVLEALDDEPDRRHDRVNGPDAEGRSALWCACNGGVEVATVDLLLDAGADPLEQHEGRTLPWLLCSWLASDERTAILGRLMRTPARETVNVSSTNAWGSTTALHQAIAHGNAAAIRVLLDAGADWDLPNVRERLAEQARHDPGMAGCWPR